jgi:hypothetical protein
LAARRRLLDPAGLADLGAGAAVDLETELKKTLAALPVSVTAQAPEGSGLKSAVESAVTGLGLPVGGASPALAVSATLSVEPFDRGNPQWTFYRWAGSVALTDPATGRNLASSSRDDQEGHLVAATAQTKARAAGEEALAQEAARLLNTYLFGE